jgi:hypothetical protein
MGSSFVDAATLVIVSSRPLCGTQQTWPALCPASTASSSGTARASSSPSPSSGRRLFLRLHVMVRRRDSRHRFESLAVWNAADVAGTLPRVDGFAVRHRSCLLVTELFFGSATLPAAARHGAPPAAGDAAADASGVAKHRRFHRQAPWALFIVVVMGSTLDDAATLAIVPSRSLCGTQQTWRAFCPASTALPSSTARASSSPSSTSGRRLFLRLHVMVRRLLRALQLMPLV